MEMSALWKLSYGMYAIGTMDGKRPTGCIVNTVIQITSDNPVIAVSMNKNNYTYECIKRTGRFSVSIVFLIVSIFSLNIFISKILVLT